MNRFEQFKKEFMEMKLEELAEYMVNNFSQEELCSCCSPMKCEKEDGCLKGVVSYLKEEVNAE